MNSVRYDTLCLLPSSYAESCRYNDALIDSLGDIRDKCESLLRSGDENIRHHVQQYLYKVQILEKVVLWSENENAQIDDAQDLTPEAEEKLQNLLDQISDQQVAVMKERLDELKWLLDDPADIPLLLGGSDARVEQVCLMGLSFNIATNLISHPFSRSFYVLPVSY
jgi:hypothetical protein